jgi:hypothetical protein
LEAHLLNGSYSFTEQSFIGSQTGPIIDSQGPHPGEGWEELTERPVDSTGRMVIVFLNSAEQITAQLREGLEDTPIPPMV